MHIVNASAAQLNNDNKKKLGLYIHIPFCVKKCDYCDFLSAPGTNEMIEEYFDALLTEIEGYRNTAEDFIVPTVFFGGGTPSVVDAIYIERMMNALSRIFLFDRQYLEATIEVNPGTVTPEKLKTYQKIGINRLSFGLQSVDNMELSMLGRIHTYEQFEANYYLARQLGFQNINIDLMSALPGQTLKSWENTLNQVISLNPEHISAYSLIIEEGTKFYDRYHEKEKDLPDEETDRLIYHLTKELLRKNGYNRYEISNYAREGYECRHNQSYWVGTDYLGIGLGAASLWKGTRFSNIRDIRSYIQICREWNTNSANNSRNNAIPIEENLFNNPTGLRENIEYLATEQRMEEFMFLGLRLCRGISRKEFKRRFNLDIDIIYGETLKQLTDRRLIELENDTIRLTDFGIDISNYVLAQFLLD